MASPTFKNLTGQFFGRLEVKERAEANTRSGKAQWICLCKCGRTCVVIGDNLRTGHTISCGCFRDEAHKSHGKARTRVYHIWQGMKHRCQNPNFKHFRNYGGKGVKVCERWMSFESFYADMGEPPTNKHTIERRNSNGDYEPENCVWATRKEQARNLSFNRIITFAGRSVPMFQWAEEFGLNPATLRYRFNNGWTVEEAITTPVLRRRSVLP